MWCQLEVGVHGRASNESKGSTDKVSRLGPILKVPLLGMVTWNVFGNEPVLSGFECDGICMFGVPLKCRCGHAGAYGTRTCYFDQF